MTEQNKLWVLYWRNHITGTTGKGTPTENKVIALQWCSKLNVSNPDIAHWVEEITNISETEANQISGSPCPSNDL